MKGHDVRLGLGAFLLPAAALLIAGAVLAQGQNQTLQGGVQQNQTTLPADVFAAGGPPDPQRRYLPPSIPPYCYPGRCNEVTPQPPKGTFNLDILESDSRSCVERYAAKLNSDLIALTPQYRQLYYILNVAERSQAYQQYVNSWNKAFQEYDNNVMTICQPQNHLIRALPAPNAPFACSACPDGQKCY